MTRRPHRATPVHSLALHVLTLMRLVCRQTVAAVAAGITAAAPAVAAVATVAAADDRPLSTPERSLVLSGCDCVGVRLATGALRGLRGMVHCVKWSPPSMWVRCRSVFVCVLTFKFGL